MTNNVVHLLENSSLSFQWDSNSILVFNLDWD